MMEMTAIGGDRAQASAGIELELSALLHERSRRASAYGAHFNRLWQLASDRVLGGKLLRPKLLVSAFDALTDSSGEASDTASRAAAIRLAAAVELLHYAFLLHDDVIDGDLIRRHRPNLIGALADEARSRFGDRPLAPRCGSNALPWSQTGGILMGDLMLSAAYQAFAREELAQSTRIRLLDILDRSITDSVAGEYLDVGLSSGAVAAELDQVLSTSRLKTATYSFELPMRAGAILAGADPRVEAALGEAGERLGLAFQLQDDLFSTFGSSEGHGKDSFSDLREGKETAIIAYARTTSHWPAIRPFFGSADFDDEDGRAARELLSACGADEFTRGLVQEQIDSALESISRHDSPLPGGARRLIIDLIATLEGRWM